MTSIEANPRFTVGRNLNRLLPFCELLLLKLLFPDSVSPVGRVPCSETQLYLLLHVVPHLFFFEVCNVVSGASLPYHRQNIAIVEPGKEFYPPFHCSAYTTRTLTLVWLDY
jgi:hypothetical protein